MTGLPHAAVLQVTGWPEPDDEQRGIRVGGLLIRTRWRPPEGPPARVTVAGYPKTDAEGHLRHLMAFRSGVRPANTVNGTQLRVTGQLIRLDRHAGLIRLKVCPSLSAQTPFIVTMHATRQILDDLDPTTFHVQAQGRLLSPAGLLLADAAAPVHAPVPERWWRWRPRRKGPRA